MDQQSVAAIGLGFGDESKGSIVEYLASSGTFDRVVRFSGGAQAAHHVVDEAGRVHRFSQFGSGTMQGVPTFLSRYMMVDPIRLTAEATHLEELGVVDPYSTLTVADACWVTTPYHAEANRAKEIARGHNRHGSCGVGIGETVEFGLMIQRAGRMPLCVADFAHADTLAGKLRFMLGFYTKSNRKVYSASIVPTVDELVDIYLGFAQTVQIADGHESRRIIRDDRCIFEGSQGVLLDEWYGFHPYTTWSTTTFEKADVLLGEVGQEAYHLGVLRSYTTRHGAGPFPTEDLGITSSFLEEHNDTGKYQGAWRAGHFDAVLHRYAAEAAGRVDGLALTHLDRDPVDICTGYNIDGLEVSRLRPKLPGNKRDLVYQENLTKALRRAEPIYGTPQFVRPMNNIEDAMGIPLVITSTGSKASDKKGSL